MALFSLDAELVGERKITDRKSKYLVRVTAPVDMAKAFYDYSEHFHDAAHRIAVYLLETDHPSIAELDTYFFSLAFLYRHSIELILKAISFQTILTVENRVIFAKDTFHDLEKILDEIINQKKCPRTEAEIEWIKDYFTDLSKMDKESDSFRYPFHIRRSRDQFGNVNFSLQKVFEKQTHVNLCQFANKFEVCFEILRLWYNNDATEVAEWKDYSPIFLEEGGPYYGQAVVGYGYKRQDFHPYFRAYMETAGLLRTDMINQYDKGDVSVADKLFMPMCYLYRNAVELSLKAIWFEEVREDFQKRCKILNKKKHSISGMWNSVKNWILEFYDEEATTITFFDEIEKYCVELQGYDNVASRFRYPCDKDMHLHYKSDTILDIMNIAEFMEGLINSLDCIDAELNHRNEYINEMEAEYKAEMEAEYRAEMASEMW